MIVAARSQLWQLLLAALLVTGSAGTGLAQDRSGEVAYPGVSNMALAQQDWFLNCQGCHKPDATGSPLGAPDMSGVIGRFLSVPGGRAYLSSVPGVANAPISDVRTAEVLNWTLYRYDRANVPDDFVPYSGDEVGKFRSKPLISRAPVVRAELIKALEAQ